MEPEPCGCGRGVGERLHGGGSGVGHEVVPIGQVGGNLHYVVCAGYEVADQALELAGREPLRG